MKSKMKYAMMFIALLAFAPMLCLAGDYDPHYNFYMSNNIWMMVATFLVFTMHLGFAMLETGLTRAKKQLTFIQKHWNYCYWYSYLCIIWFWVNVSW